MGWTAKPAVQTVTWAGIARPSAVTAPVGSTRAMSVCSCTVMPSRSNAVRRWLLGLLAQPVAEAAAGGERDLEVRPGFGDLGGGFDAGEATTDDEHGCARGEVGQPLSQPQRGLLAGDVVGVLGDAGDAVVGGGAAEGVDERVVGDLAGAVGVDEATVLRSASTAVTRASRTRTPVPAKTSLSGRGLQVLAGRELVHADALDELGVGVDEGDLGVVGVQPLGEAPGGVGSGVSGPENDDAVLHGFAPVWLVFAS